MIDKIKSKFKSLEQRTVLFLVIILVCAVGICIFLQYYYSAYKNPYLQKEVHILTEDWQYIGTDGESRYLATLDYGPKLKAGELLKLQHVLEAGPKDAALLVRANHQTVRVYLDDILLFQSETDSGRENPGMALHFIPLPNDYMGKTLKLEITSPYTLYAGRTSKVMLGTIPSLEAYSISHSMRALIMMSMCLLLGICTIALTAVQAIQDFYRPQNLALGIFAMVWALYYVCTEYIVYQFFTPTQMSLLSLGLYFFFQVPLTLFFYFSFQHYKKWMIPAILVPIVFVLAAFLLQATNRVQLPQLINLNNVLLAGLLYTVVLVILEAVKKNGIMMLAAPMFIIAYGSMIYNFSVFYNRHGTVPYSYRDTYFLLILSVLIYNIQQFFSQFYRQKQEVDILTLQNRLAKESYEEIKNHLSQVGSLKHEVKSHLEAMQIYLQDGRYQQAREYLGRYVKQVSGVTEVVYNQHYLVNALVGRLVHSAQQKGIKVELNLKAIPTGITDPDLYSLLNNILENALEACICVPEDKLRFIKLTITNREPYLHISCENSKYGMLEISEGGIQTTKADSRGHGFGLLTVSGIVNTYDGIMDIDQGESFFSVSVALKKKTG